MRNQRSYGSVCLERIRISGRDDINAELDNGWHIATSMYLQADDDLLIIFTKPKRN